MKVPRIIWMTLLLLIIHLTVSIRGPPLSVLSLCFLFQKSNNCLVGLDLEKPFPLLLAFSTGQKTLPMSCISILFCMGCPFEFNEVCHYYVQSPLFNSFDSSVFFCYPQRNKWPRDNKFHPLYKVSWWSRPLKWHLNKRTKFSIQKLE